MKLSERYRHVEDNFEKAYRKNVAYAFARTLFMKTKKYFRSSFIGKITDMKKGKGLLILDNSILIRWMSPIFKMMKERAADYLKQSKIVNFFKKIKGNLRLDPLKSISLIIVVLILANMVLSVLIKKEIDLFGWIIRGGFLFAALSGLFCRAGWNEVKNTSFILRLVDNARFSRLKR